MLKLGKMQSKLQFSAPAYKECFSSTTKMCSNDFYIEKSPNDNLDKDQCINYCDGDNNCKFVSYAIKSNGAKICRKYRSCDKSRFGNNVATTYSKDGACPGTIL